MLTMDQIHHIRALYYEQGYNISEIAEATGRDWKTVAKYIDMADFNEPLPIPASEKQFCPKLEPYKSIINSWLSASMDVSWQITIKPDGSCPFGGSFFSSADAQRVLASISAHSSSELTCRYLSGCRFIAAGQLLANSQSESRAS